MARWESNGEGSSPNEEKLVGQRVVFSAGGQIRGIGKLTSVRAATRGNSTLAVVWHQLNAAGRTVKREVPLWMFRKHAQDFTLELADDSNAEQAAWSRQRRVVRPA